MNLNRALMHPSPVAVIIALVHLGNILGRKDCILNLLFCFTVYVLEEKTVLDTSVQTPKADLDLYATKYIMHKLMITAPILDLSHDGMGFFFCSRLILGFFEEFTHLLIPKCLV